MVNWNIPNIPQTKNPTSVGLENINLFNLGGLGL